MPTFRKMTPKRRPGTKTVSNYRSHKKNLKEDFNNRCGYCDDLDIFRRAHYEIDHFIPKEFLKEKFPAPDVYKNKIQEYSNLVYSCHSCNNAKGKQWPTASMDIHHKNGIGFIDPCEPKYDNQFERNEKGEIIPKTELGKWMHKALNLGKPEHSIIWHLDELDQVVNEIEKLLTDIVPGEKEKLEKKHYLALQALRKYQTQLRDY